MTLFRSVRSRLTFWYAAMLLAGLLAFSGWMWFSVRQYLAASADDRIERRMQGLKAAIDEESDESINVLREELREFGIEIPEGELTAVRGRGARDLLLPAGIPGPLLWSAPEGRIGDLYANSIRYRAMRRHLTVNGETYDLAAATSTSEADGFLQQFRWLLIGAAPMMALAASLGGYWMSRRALSPVDELTSAARRISLDNLAERLPVSRSGDELERLGDTWNEMLSRLDSAVERMRQFTADASHELRTPISIIRTTSELALRRERAPDEYRKALESIHQESQWMTQLAEHLLLLARADAGALRLNSERLEIDRLVQEIVRETEPMAEIRGIWLQTQLGAGAVFIQADGHALRRILAILLENALQHTPAAGTIEVETSAAEGRVVVAVRDNGEGIPGEDLPHIFERFYRGDPARTRRSGAGLGLAIARSLAHALGVEIEVESDVGQGAEFLLRFEIADKTAAVGQPVPR